ncbi:hypothetical protein COM03_06335 [Bacillus wiedmannii]|nr:hypothetical protein CON90_10325 [Bacillus toyonensis]PGB84103.1 hypothetical protein COM03_06335 [Bacillus wiedmannii]
MCKEEEKDMPAAEAIVRSISKDSMPKERSHHIEKALKQVELIQKGELPRKSARDFLRESRERGR